MNQYDSILETMTAKLFLGIGRRHQLKLDYVRLG